MGREPSVIVLSHLRWNSVFQRPQHLLSRMAKSGRVLFVEEPVFDANTSGHWKITDPVPNLLVCQPHTPIGEAGYCDAQMELLGRLVRELIHDQRVASHIAWLYTPMALPLVEQLNPEVVVYDCMDALDAFLGAPRALRQREDELLARADLVFTGGPSLYRRMEGRHANAHCFPSSVDAQHFAQAIGGASEPPDQSGLPRPRLGYFGVIDERLDLSLLDAMAEAHLDWQFVMVGPVVKISAESLPRRANLQYLGQRSYAELPGYASGWDVCLMPFALNDATRYISPTKVLEYMATERPIVSTRITDVAEPYGHIVFIADTPEEFVAACEQVLAEGPEEREQRAARMRRVLSNTSWDRTVAQMQGLVAKCRGSKRATHSRGYAAAAPASQLRRLDSAKVRRPALNEPAPVVVIGAGPTGLSAAYHLGKDALLLEQNDEVGGWCRSIELNGFTFDFAGHIMFSNDPYVHQMYEMLLGENVHWQDREAWIYSKEVYTRYPFQGALYGLPPEVISECIVGAVEARYGAEKAPLAGGLANGCVQNGHAAHTGAVHTNGNGKAHTNGHSARPIEDCCADGVMESTAVIVNGHHQANGNGQSNGSHQSNGHPAAEPRNFEEFIYKVWGAGIAKHFAIPYNKKLWAVPLSDMDTSWLGGRVPMPDLREMIEGALRPVPKPMGPNARFGYPLRGGFQALMDGFVPHVADRLRYNARVTAVRPREHEIELNDGTVIPYEHLISTMPLPVLVQCMGTQAPAEVRKAASRLRYVSVQCVHLGIGRENLTEKHWIYYPEDTVFHRIFVQGNASPHCNPPGGFGLTCEITYSEHKPLPCEGQALIDRCIADCRKVGIIEPNDPIWAATQCDLPHAYVVYDHARPKIVKLIRDWLAMQDIILAGRYSEWEYYNSDHAFIAGKKAAETVKSLQSVSQSRAKLPSSLAPTG